MNDLAAMQERITHALEKADANVPRFTFYTADQLGQLLPLEWRVQHVLPTMGLASIFGPSGSGKSFLLLDLMAAVAEGAPWFEHETKECRILCLVLEGQAGYKQRTDAWAKHYGRAFPTTVSFMPDTFDLIATEDVNDLIADIKADGGFDMIFIDTLNRAAPNGDENSSQHMSSIIKAAAQLQEATGGLVVLVHHTGKDASRGMRGHSSLISALDAAIEVSRSGDERGWKLHKVKDGRDGDIYPFVLTEVPLGDDGDPSLSSCVVSPVAGGVNLFGPDGTPEPKTPNQKTVLAAVVTLLQESDEVGQGGAPSEASCVLASEVIQKAKEEVSGGLKHRAERVREALTWLSANGFVVTGDDGWLWLPQE